MSEKTDSEPKVIAFDFDGVVAMYYGYQGPHNEETPRPAVVDTMKQLSEEGFKIMIHSTRGTEFIKQYCVKNEIPFDYINERKDKEGENPGKPIATVYVDDRALNYNGQDTATLVEQIKSFAPHREKNNQ